MPLLPPTSFNFNTVSWWVHLISLPVYTRFHYSATSSSISNSTKMASDRNANIATAAAMLVAAVFLSTTGVAAAQIAAAPAPAPGPSAGPNCFTIVLNMSDCLTYVEAGSNLTKPEKPCCPELAGLVESNPVCLCQLVGKSGSLGIQIDLHRALQLPSVCGVETPPLSLCSVAGIPVGALSPSGAPLSPGGVPPAGSAASPLTGNNGNGLSSTSASPAAFLVGLAFALSAVA